MVLSVFGGKFGGVVVIKLSDGLVLVFVGFVVLVF